MKVSFIKALWGMEGSLESQLSQIQFAGYAGFETGLPTAGPTETRKLASDHGLKFVMQAYLTTIDELKAAIEGAGESGAVLLNIHTGKDWWSFDQGCAFFEEAVRLQRQAPCPLVHETHRGRMMFAPAVTRAYLEKFPDLRITADFSHFTCVCETLLEDQAETVDFLLRRTGHVHARVGFEEGPQVNDPRAPEWERCVVAFEAWWDKALAYAKAEGREEAFVTPEFGPPNYMPTQPFTRMPLADLWEVCLWMRDRLRARWASS